MPSLSDRSLSKREVLKELGITDRLLKFWMGWYKLPLNRRGRGSTYPAQTVETLRLIKNLSDSRYFTMKFIRDLFQVSQIADRTRVESYLSLCKSISSFARRAPSAVRPPSLDAAPGSAVSDRPSAYPAAAGVAHRRMGEDLL